MSPTPRTNEIKELLSKWGKIDLPSKNLLYEYMPLCRGLLYEDEDIVRETTSLLRRNITLWAKAKSPVYKNMEGVISRDELNFKASWYVLFMFREMRPMATSGSTTGRPFEYMRWEPFLYPIEAENHYDLIMDEFEIRQEPDVLYFFNTSRYDPGRLVTVSSESDNFMEHHGLKRRARVHYVNFARFESEREGYTRDLAGYLADNPVDVIFAPGPSVNALCSSMRNMGSHARICGLLSNSNERLLPDDAAFLLGGPADHVCDHMRCWDGGASFFTCRHGNYHLLDNLSWCEDVDGKLVSTDYFSLPCPFVRYWNGDFCRITDTYSRCGCGRLYRGFKFLENRPFALKGRSITEVREALQSLGIMGLKHVRCSADHIEVVTRTPIQEGHRRILESRFKFAFRFAVEQ